MEDLKLHFKKSKEVFLKRKHDHDFVDKHLKEILEQDFSPGLISKYIKSFYLKKSILVIETTSKVFAQELFWKKENLQNKINFSKKLVKEIIIR